MTVDDRPQARTLRQLLLELRAGYVLHRPILVDITFGDREDSNSTLDRTLTLQVPTTSTEDLSNELAACSFMLLGPNTLSAGIESPVTIGRSRRCDVRIENDSVSKVHATVAHDQQRSTYILVDKDSRNGTRLNGKTLVEGEPIPLYSGAHIAFGDAVFVFIDPPTLRKLSRIAS